MRLRDLIFVSMVLGGGMALARGVLRPPASVAVPVASTAASKADLGPVVEQVNDAFRLLRAEKELTPAPRAPELAVMRRLSLALTGSIPSLEEIRQFEARPAEGRIDAWLDDLLRDRRTADYLAERFARVLVGTEDGPFLQFRRRRFTTWLSDAILANRPYDAMVRDLIADQGLWTDHPATNFVSVTFSEETQRPDPERLAARVSRAFLGVRLDCAQCHDHPFQPWKQADFRGLAAYFGGVYSSLRGIRDRESKYKPLDRKTKEPTKVEPRVPFQPELVPAAGNPREQLAGWIVNPATPTSPGPRSTECGPCSSAGPWSSRWTTCPLRRGPPGPRSARRGFPAHGYDLHRLIRVIAAIELFRLDSADDATTGPAGPRDENWAAFR